MGGHAVLLMTEDLAQASLGLVALHGWTDGGRRSDDAHAGNLDFREGGKGGWFAPRLGRNGAARFPPKRKSPAVQTTPLFAHRANVALATKVLLGAEPHGPARRTGRTPLASAGGDEGNQTTVRRLRPLSRRDLMTLRPLLVAIRAR